MTNDRPSKLLSLILSFPVHQRIGDKNKTYCYGPVKPDFPAFTAPRASGPVPTFGFSTVLALRAYENLPEIVTRSWAQQRQMEMSFEAVGSHVTPLCHDGDRLSDRR